MGKEVSHAHFSPKDEARFLEKLQAETELLRAWFDSEKFYFDRPTLGLELEAWLVTPDFVPAPLSEEFVAKVNHPFVVPEISRFNFELNSDPYALSAHVFSQMEKDLAKLWKQCEDKAQAMGLKALIIGTLPTLRDHMLTMDQLTPKKRYFALNERVMQLRQGEPICLDIEGKDHVHLVHQDVLTECAATSMQIHYSIPTDLAAKYYNASIISSAFMAAVTANSPFFMGQEVWDESRLGVFEQSVNLRMSRSGHQVKERVGLGSGYVKESVMELFDENLKCYELLLPDVDENAQENKLEHLRLQNGCIWRWNRPLIGFYPDGKPSLRLEFRVPSAGPTLKDVMANMVLQIALVEVFVKMDKIEERLPFSKARANFYQAARFGLDARIEWFDGIKVSLQELLFQELIPLCHQALMGLGVHEKEIHHYLWEIIEPRIRSGQNGASWQKAFVHTHGSRFQELLESYHKFQKENLPVHLWSV
jgi:gamma-glutamyl:cysteine ligase YbdK (ATP-grasp superfamily)